MRYVLATAAVILALGGCSGSEPKGGNQFNDVATGVTLARERPLERATSPTLRVTRLAECAATLTAVARTTPPHERAARLLEAADRIVRLATQLARTTGQTAADVTRIRDQTLAAYRQLEQNYPRLYAENLRLGERACEVAEIMTDDELIRGPAIVDFEPTTLGNEAAGNALNALAPLP